MPRIAGTNIPENKRIEIALTYVYGIGPSLSKKIIKEANIDSSKKSSELTKEELDILRKIIDSGYKIEGDLKREIMMDIKRLKEIGCWRGSRHTKRLPVRGQRTKTNNRTVRGNIRKTVGSGRKAPPSPK
jgi:small subunit ribosomal protein S13